MVSAVNKEDIKEEVLAELRRVNSPFKVASNLGYPVAVVWEIMDDNRDNLQGLTERYDGDGRPDLRPFIVAKKKRGSSWNNEEPAVAKARADYEAGTHDMMTHYDGPHAFLISKPMRRPGPARTDYFKPEL